MLLIEQLQQNPALFLFATAIIGLAVGSFLNVVIYRLPVMLEQEWEEQCQELRGESTTDTEHEPFNLSHPRSRCQECGHQIAFWENIPIISYILLRGRCSACGNGISLRYPVVEMVTALLSVAVAWHFGFSWQTAAALPLTWALIALTMIDYDHKLLPDSVVLPLLWLGLLVNLQGGFTDLASAVTGAIAGYMSLWSIFQLFRLITGKEGMGYGDFKLLAMLGAWLGWQYLFQIVLISSLVGAIVGISLVLALGRDRTLPIPFGPYLATAGWISLLWGEEINLAYLRFSGLA
ncbi:MAG: prepilin peptidase [Gammaproteobacteria bacterium]|nr:prepilin peptidase [Gammaproteobacteria bacterium]